MNCCRMVRVSAVSGDGYLIGHLTCRKSKQIKSTLAVNMGKYRWIGVVRAQSANAVGEQRRRKSGRMGLDGNHKLLRRWCLEDHFGACEVNGHFLQDHSRNRVVKYHKCRIEQEYMVERAVAFRSAIFIFPGGMQGGIYRIISSFSIHSLH